MKLFYHVGTCFSVSTLASAVMRLVSPGEDLSHATTDARTKCRQSHIAQFKKTL